MPIKLGRHSYIIRDGNLPSGILNIYDIPITLGNFCSVGLGLHIIAGEHPIVNHPECVSSFEFDVCMGIKEYTKKGFYGNPITIGNDVWIGSEVALKHGITIGDGAVIAARSVVVKDVAPYEIVGGNPAKHIRFRFDANTIERLKKIKWWDWSDAEIKERIELLMDVQKLIAWH